MELLNLDPELYLFHDVITDSEIKHVKKLAKPQVSWPINVAKLWYNLPSFDKRNLFPPGAIFMRHRVWHTHASPRGFLRGDRAKKDGVRNYGGVPSG